MLRAVLDPKADVAGPSPAPNVEPDAPLTPKPKPGAAISPANWRGGAGARFFGSRAAGLWGTEARDWRVESPGVLRARGPAASEPKVGAGGPTPSPKVNPGAIDPPPIPNPKPGAAHSPANWRGGAGGRGGGVGPLIGVGGEGAGARARRARGSGASPLGSGAVGLGGPGACAVRTRGPRFGPGAAG